MSDWIRRLYHSPRARRGALAALAILWAGGTAGTLLANYTVAESNIAQYRASQEWRTLASVPAPPPQWVEQAAVEVSDAGFSPQHAEGYSDASY